MHKDIESLKSGLIVSCQSEGTDPFNHPEYLALFARAAEMGGARGIRAQGTVNISAICRSVSLPVIGITKGAYADGWVLITPDFSDVDAVIASGAQIIALDATARIRPNGMDGRDFFAEVRKRYGVPLMADCSTFEEGVAAAEAGADIVATTLSGYTAETEGHATDEPDYDLVKSLVRAVSVPVIAEGRIWTPAQARQALECGAYAVVVGTAITRPRVVTQKFVESMGKIIKHESE
ncbi:MAG: N-acetylmannosamine-6-phosphate 2-epimerase [Acidobacteriota bacterium]